MKDQDDEPPEAFRRLGDGPPLPSDLEERVMRELRRRGAIGPGTAPRRPDRWRWTRRLAGGVAALAAAAVLVLLGRATASVGTTAPEPRWILLLYEDREYRAPAPAEERARAEEYRAWGDRVRAVDGAELGPDAVLLGDPAADPIADPAGGPLGRLAGYFVLAAPDLGSARASAAVCPHLKYGGRLVIRPMR